MKKPQKKRPRRWKCQGIVERGRCKNYALLETTTKLSGWDFAFPVKVKLCLPCDVRFNTMFPKLADIKRTPES